MIIQRPGGYTSKLSVISDKAEMDIPTGRSMKRSHEAESISKIGDGESSDNDSEDLHQGSVLTGKGLLKGENKRLQDRILEEQETNRRLTNKCRELMESKEEAERKLTW